MVLLDEVGYADQAVAIGRSIIEHVLALRWLAADGDRIENPSARGQALAAQKRRDAHAGAGWTIVDLDQFDAVIASTNADTRGRTDDQYLNFSPRLRAYGDAASLPQYLASCERVHPSYQSALSYVDVDVTDPDRPAPAHRHTPNDAIGQIPFATAHVLEALLHFRVVFNPMPWEAELANLQKEFRRVTANSRDLLGLPPLEPE